MSVELQNYSQLKNTDCKIKRRAGILVLINDSDWELYEEYDYELEAGDTISFISTLHGG